MKIIFLDCDGVLNHRGCNFKHDHTPVDPACMKLLIRLIERSGAMVVVSSSWRHMPDWRERLIVRGLPPGVIWGRTKLQGSSRGEEISEWLAGRKVESFVVLDDTVFDLDPHLSRTVQTSMEHGLELRHVDAALTILNSEV